MLSILAAGVFFSHFKEGFIRFSEQSDFYVQAVNVRLTMIHIYFWLLNLKMIPIFPAGCKFSGKFAFLWENTFLSAIIFSPEKRLLGKTKVIFSLMSLGMSKYTFTNTAFFGGMMVKLALWSECFESDS